MITIRDVPTSSRIVGHLLAVALGLTALLKLLDVEAFAQTLAGWTLIPDRAAAPIATLIPAMEIGAAAAWFMLPWPRAAIAAMGALIAAFTAGYAAEMAVAEAPDCGCLGVLMKYEAFRSEGWGLIARNGVLVAAAGAALWIARPTAGSENRRSDSALSETDPTANPARGFTIIELLVVIAVLAVIVSITLPVLRSIRLRSEDAVSLANLRTHAQTMAAYQADHNDAFLNFVPRNTYETEISYGYLTATLEYWDQPHRWMWGLADGYYNGRINDESFVAPGYGEFLGLDPGVTYAGGYLYSSAFLATPEFWDRSTREGSHQYVVVYAHQVVYPDRKAFFSYAERTGIQSQTVGYTESSPFHLGTTDGAARIVETADIDRGEWLTDFVMTWPGLKRNLFEPGVTTKHGVRGRDLVR